MLCLQSLIMKHTVAFIISIFPFLIVFGQTVNPAIKYFTPSNHTRMAAEWEPAQGVLFAWPPSIPHALIKELAHDTRLFVLIDSDRNRQDATKWFSEWKIESTKVKFIKSPHGVDVSWTRDWGPHAFFRPGQKMKLADGKYLYATPVVDLECDSLNFLYKNKDGSIIQTTVDDVIPDYIANELNMNIDHLPFAFTGGNVFFDGQQTAFSTCALTMENKYMGIADTAFFSLADKMLGIKQYHIISNFEKKGIQHIDCFMKLLDDERMLVMRPPADHPLFAQYEKMVHEELAGLLNPFGRPYQILRLDTDSYSKQKLAAYSNSLILNKCIYVPLFGIPQDTIALTQWKGAMPGYKIKGFEFKLKDEPALSEDAKKNYSEIGWTDGDALHCRTRAIWDPNMIYISVDRVPSFIKNKIKINAIIKNYGEGQLNTPELIWRKNTKSQWRKTKMAKSGTLDLFTASVKNNNINGLNFYVTATSSKGINNSMPLTAPNGYYSYSITK